MQVRGKNHFQENFSSWIFLPRNENQRSSFLRRTLSTSRAIRSGKSLAWTRRAYQHSQGDCLKTLISTSANKFFCRRLARSVQDGWWSTGKSSLASGSAPVFMWDHRFIPPRQIHRSTGGHNYEQFPPTLVSVLCFLSLCVLSMQT